MSAVGRGAGMSRYAGLRVTVTFHPKQEDIVLLSVAAKQVSGGWDEWSALCPTRRIQGEVIADLQGCLDLVFDELDACEDIAWSRSR